MVKTNETECFGVHNLNDYAREHFIVKEDGFTDNERLEKETLSNYGIDIVEVSRNFSVPTLIVGDTEYAHKDGWKVNRATLDRTCSENTKVFSLILSGNRTFFANDYLVSGFAKDEKFIHTPLRIEVK